MTHCVSPVKAINKTCHIATSCFYIVQTGVRSRTKLTLVFPFGLSMPALLELVLVEPPSCKRRRHELAHASSLVPALAWMLL